MQFGREQGRGPSARFGVQLLLGARPLQAVDGPPVDHLVQRLGKPLAIVDAHVGDAALVGRGEVRAEHVVGALAPRVLDHVRIGGHGGAALREAAVRRVLLVLESGLLVGAGLLALPALLQADYHADGHQHHQGHERGYRRDHHHVLGGEVGFRGDSGAGGGAGGDLFAFPPQEARGAEALEAVDSVHARAAVLAGVHLAFVYFVAAVFAGEAGRTFALVVVDELLAGAPVGAGFRDAVVDAVLAQRSYVSRYALATEFVHFVDAGPSVQARITLAIVYVDFAGVAGESRRTRALVAGAGFRAGSTVLAGTRRATARLVLAIGPAEAGPASAPVSGVGVDAGAAVFATFLRTGLHGGLASGSGEAGGANAYVVFAFGAARPAVQAGAPGTVVHGYFAVGAVEAVGAAAGVTALAGVEASAAVSARFVVGAEVQVLVAEQAAPAFVAEAIPRFQAGTVDATRVTLTLVAEGPLPPRLTPETIRRIGYRRTLVFTSLFNLLGSHRRPSTTWTNKLINIIVVIKISPASHRGSFSFLG